MLRAIEADVTVEDRDGNEHHFDSFREAAEAGYPVACEWFALCDNAATVALAHPILTAVPTCDRCAERVEALS